jgi:molybdopterin molybdotransferase
VLRAAQIGAAAALGYARLPVYRPVTVLVLSTGSELAEPGTALRPGQIYESNGAMLAAAVTEAGAIARTVHFVADDVDAFHTALHDTRAGVDVVVTSGGVSAGAYEVVKDALAGAGVDFAKVAMQPGMPQGAGRVDGLPFVTLPGNPVSSYVSFEVFLRPVIRSAMGFPSPQRPVVRVPLSQALDSPAGKRQFRRATLDAVAGTVAPFGGAGSHLLGALAGADCLLVVPEDVEHLDAGDVVDVWLLEA